MMQEIYFKGCAYNRRNGRKTKFKGEANAMSLCNNLYSYVGEVEADCRKFDIKGKAVRDGNDFDVTGLLTDPRTHEHRLLYAVLEEKRYCDKIKLKGTVFLDNEHYDVEIYLYIKGEDHCW